MLGVTEAITKSPAIICTEIEFSKGVVSWLESMDFSLDGTHSKFAYNTCCNDDALCANVFIYYIKCKSKVMEWTWTVHLNGEVLTFDCDLDFENRDTGFRYDTSSGGV